MKKLFRMNIKILNSEIISKLNLTKALNTYKKNFSSLFDEFKKEPLAKQDFRKSTENKNLEIESYHNKKKNYSPFKKNQIKFKQIDSSSNQDSEENININLNNNNKINISENSEISNTHRTKFFNKNDGYKNNKFRSSKSSKLNVPLAKDGKPLSIFLCKSTEHVIGMYYTYKNYFNSDINILAKVLIRISQVASLEGLKGMANLSKLRIVKEIIKNLSEKIDKDNSQTLDNDVIIDIMKILKYHKIVQKQNLKKYEFENDEDKNKYQFKPEDKELEMLIENFIIEKVLKNLHLKIFLKNLENGNQLTSFIQNLTYISKITDLKKNFKFLFFKAEILNNYDTIFIKKYQTRNLIALLWALSNTHLNLPEVYHNITNELINRFEYLEFENKIQILITSAIQNNVNNKKLILMIFNDFKNQIKKDGNYLLNLFIKSKLIYFKEFLLFLDFWGKINKKVDSVMNEEIFNNIMKFIYYKFISKRFNGDDIIFSENNEEKEKLKIILIEKDRIAMLSFLLRYSEYSNSFNHSELCFDDLKLNDKEEEDQQLEKLKLKGKETDIEQLKLESDEEESKLLNEINKNTELLKNEENLNSIDKNDYEKKSSPEEKLIKGNEIEDIGNQYRKYEMDIPNIIEELINNFGYNIFGYIEYSGYHLLSMILIDKKYKMLNLFNLIMKILSEEHYKISPKEYIKISSFVLILLKMQKFHTQNEKFLLNTKKDNLNDENNVNTNNKTEQMLEEESKKRIFFKLLKNYEKNLINFSKGIINENNLKYNLQKNCEFAIIMDIIEIIDKIRIFDNLIFSKITNIASEEIKAFLDTSKIKELTFDQILCLNYLIITLKISLEKNISETLKKTFIDKYRDNFGKNSFKPFKKVFLNSLLYFTDKKLRLEMEASESNKGINSEGEISNKEIAEDLKKRKVVKDFDSELLKILKEENLQNYNNNDEKSLMNFDLALNEFVHFDNIEYLRLPENIGIEERDIYFSLSTYDKLDTLLGSIKNLKYVTNKVFDSNFYLDYYLPKLKFGFIIFNPVNYFEIIDNPKVLQFDDFPSQRYLSIKPLALRPVIELFKTKYNIDVFIINEKNFEYKADDILNLIKKYNISNN